ncbi:MAG TPA: hypothetical protein VIW23_11615 [Candidatus Acidoferrum sp.]|jgi:hypothetical protein
MSSNSGKNFQIVAAVLMGLVPFAVASAQGGADSLESQLAAKYKLVKLGTDSSGLAVTDPGTVLVIKKGGILSVASGNMVVIPTYVKDGQVKTANNGAMTGVNKFLKWKGVSDPTGTNSTDTKFLTVGEKVYVSKIDINRKDSKVSLAIIECDTCNSVQEPSLRKAQVVFQFPKDYLSGADGGQISDVVGQILEVQPEETGDQQQGQGQDAQGQQPAAPQQEAPAQPPATVQMGQSVDEVQAALGAPTKIFNLGAKQIYVYKDVKVTFIRGRVVDVQ